MILSPLPSNPLTQRTGKSAEVHDTTPDIEATATAENMIATLAADCVQPVGSTFGGVWAACGDLGCPVNEEHTTQVFAQEFINDDMMLWREDQGSVIYVLSLDQLKLRYFEDVKWVWHSDRSYSPAIGYEAPAPGFSELWEELGGAGGIGWANTKGAKMSLLVQDFENGFMTYVDQSFIGVFYPSEDGTGSYIVAQANLPDATVAPGGWASAVTTTDLNVFQGPGQDYPIIGLLPVNTQVEVVGRDPDGIWWQIVYPPGSTERAWIFAAFVELSNAENVPVVELPSGELVLNVPGSDPSTLDPHLSSDVGSAEYVSEIFSGLVTFDRDLNIVPDLAESWGVSDDGTVYTFHLRKDASFHNGKPVRAQDFKWSIERACDFRTRSTTADTYLGDIVGCRDKLRGEADEVEGVQVINDQTLEITIDEPRVYFLSKLTHPTAFVLDQENVERGGRTWTDDPNGTGPFKLAELRFGELIALERNEDYYREPKPQLERVNFVISGGSRMVMYEQGELDMTTVGLNDIEHVIGPTNPLSEELYTVESIGVFYIALNTNQPPFDDMKVRQAFNHALDRQRIIDVVYKETVPVAWGIIPPTMPNYDNPDLDPLEYDPEKARALIAESEYGDVSEFPDITFHALGAGGATGRIIEAIVASYEENLGVQVEVQQTDWATFLSDLNRADNPNQMWGGEAGWIADYPDPHDFLDILFRCDSLQNHTGYCNPEVDELLNQAAGEYNPEKREVLYRRVEQIVIDEATWVPLFFEVKYWLVKPHVKDAYLPPMSGVPKYQYYYLER